MPTRTSGGLILYRKRNEKIEILLAHPGGPFFARKDEGIWSIPKGEIEEGEDLLTAARREFKEETGLAPEDPFVPLGSVTQKGGKVVYAWAVAGDGKPVAMRSNTFQMEWPPRSGQIQEFPENDRLAFFPLEEASRKINPAQALLLERLIDLT